jgi:hypothetical protein
VLGVPLLACTPDDVELELSLLVSPVVLDVDAVPSPDVVVVLTVDGAACSACAVRALMPQTVTPPIPVPSTLASAKDVVASRLILLPWTRRFRAMSCRPFCPSDR